MATYTNSASQTGTANTQFQFTITVNDLDELNIIFQRSSGNFSSESATIDVSINNSTWITADTISLGTGAIAAKTYNESSLASTLTINPTGFNYIRVTVPALGSGVSAIVTYSGKTINWH